MKSGFWLAAFACGCLALVTGTARAESSKYLGPSVVVASKDGSSLFVLNVDAKQVVVVQIASRKVARTIALPAEPTGMTLSPDGGKLYVTCVTPLGTVSAIDVSSGRITATIPAGHYAGAPVVSPDGKRLYVCNRFDNNVSAIDLEAKKEVARIPAVREPIAAAIAPDGKTLVVANLLPNDRSDADYVAAVVQLIDTASNQSVAVRLPNGSSSLRGVCVSPDGKHAYVAHVLARFHMPTTQLERGWMNTNALSILDVPGKKLVNTVLLDDVDLGAANPWGVAASADGRLVCVAHAGTHELSAIDVPGVMEKLAKIPAQAKPYEPGKPYDDRGSFSSPTQADVPNDLAFLVDLRRRISLRGISPWSIKPTGPMANGPHGVAIVGSKAYVALYFSDNLAVVDLGPKPDKPVSWIPLGPEPQLTVQRRGQMFFSDADLCFQHWQSCSSCHPDARVDGLNWDLLNDGLGNPKNNRSMLLAHRTPPSMWEGVRPTAEDAVRSGIKNIQFAVRPEEDAVAIDEYLKSLTPVPSPHLVNGQISESAKRGKALFFSERVGCATCHPEPLYTDLKVHDVESKGPYDRKAFSFDTPTLIECWRTAPYLHDGRYVTMKQVIKEGKHGRKHGEVEKLTEQEIDDLVEFVLSL
jgi:YVTN family beta-propeller protein